MMSSALKLKAAYSCLSLCAKLHGVISQKSVIFQQFVSPVPLYRSTKLNSDLRETGRWTYVIRGLISEYCVHRRCGVWYTIYKALCVVVGQKFLSVHRVSVSLDVYDLCSVPGRVAELMCRIQQQDLGWRFKVDGLVSRALPPGIRRPKREGDRSPSSDEVNSWHSKFTSLINLYHHSLVFKHKDAFPSFCLFFYILWRNLIWCVPPCSQV
jgi:hypothetical protein